MDLAALTAKVQEALAAGTGFTNKVKFDFGSVGKLFINGAAGKVTNEDGAADATISVDFEDFNQFLDVADALLEALDCVGEVQVASFHPRYRFAGTADDDITNCSNRSPYPTLHLLREASIAGAVAAFPDAADIYQRNIETLRRLGHAGWEALGLEVDAPVPEDLR